MEFHHEGDGDQEDDEEMEMPIPINTTYGHSHNHIVPLSLHHHHKPPVVVVTDGGGGGGSTAVAPPAMVVKYKECLKNHAASMGGKARDGCGEFMATGEEGTLEALICSVCNCHRNFHRKEIQIEAAAATPTSTTSYDGNHHHHHRVVHHKMFDLGLGNGGNLVLQTGPPPMIMPYSIGMGYNHQENGNGGGGGGGGGGYMSMYSAAPPHAAAAPVVKKRFRTKFTQEQKEKMYKFAEKSGWKIQRQEESVVEEFCEEIGIKRRVLKVWMHNNKQNLAKINSTNSTSINNINNNPPQNPN